MRTYYMIRSYPAREFASILSKSKIFNKIPDNLQLIRIVQMQLCEPLTVNITYRPQFRCDCLSSVWSKS